ncbi:hypothetical protein INT45_006091 [Circinella minor]|uniref:F-box domain-containing protein n=1 Tax=Circinella minor TaxID=1195481 RepID=A0A8H7VK19_9FUNG|nr:hypothetical protein INT45_006091 [Circinella minor]
MSFLLQLPQELLQLVFVMLPRQSLARFSQTCHLAYDLTSPTLYSHLQIGFRTHVRQLEEGIQRNNKLKEIMQTHTRNLTLKNHASNNLWLARDFADLLTATYNVRVLTLSNFDSLSVDYLSRLAAVLPNIECLELHYCNLTHESLFNQHEQQNPASTTFLSRRSSSSTSLLSLSNTSSSTTALFSNTRRLNFCWTDFSEAAVSSLFKRLPYLECVDLGANRNRVIGANTTAIKSLTEHCACIKELTISLQQVSESVLCDTIAYYGPQLYKLSIRCDGRETLKSVAEHATHVKNLTIRAGTTTTTVTNNTNTTQQQQQQQGQSSTLSISNNGNYHNRVDGSSPTLQPTTTTINDNTMATSDRSAVRNNQSSAQQRQRRQPWIMMNGIGEEQDEEEEEDYGSIVGILQRCRELVHLEMVSWMVQDVPIVVWRGVDAVALRRRRPLMIRKKVLPNKTLALDLEELQEIRKQFVNSHLLTDHNNIP